MEDKSVKSNARLLGPVAIPIEWEVKTLGEMCIVKGEYGINAAAVEYSEKLPTYLRITDIDEDGNYCSKDRKSVSDPNATQYILEDGDVVFARTGATVGKCYLHNRKENGELVFAGFLIRFRLDSNRLLPYYLKSYTYTSTYLNWVRMVSMRSGQPGINGREFSSLKLIVPPIAEQRTITNCLRLWDSENKMYIKLIELKQLRKKWLMQQLLTGKKRLKGFSGEWREVKLGDITTNFSRRNSDLVDAPVYSVTNSNGFVLQSEHFEREIAGNNLTSYKVIRKNEFAYNPARINVGSLAYFTDEVGIISSLYVCFSTKEEVLDYFLLQLLQLDHVKHKIESFGEGGVRVYLWYDLFAKIKVKIPDLKEQEAIAKVLQTADREIELLKLKAEKLKLQKKWLMQVLLTGKKRLPVEQPAITENN